MTAAMFVAHLFSGAWEHHLRSPTFLCLALRGTW